MYVMLYEYKYTGFVPCHVLPLLSPCLCVNKSAFLVKNECNMSCALVDFFFLISLNVLTYNIVWLYASTVKHKTRASTSLLPSDVFAYTLQVYCTYSNL